MGIYRVLFAFDTLVLLVLAYFFLDGLHYNPTADTLAIWLPLLAVPIGVLTLSWILRERGKTRLASLLLGILAVPPFLFAAFFGLLLILNPSWQ